MNRRQFLATTTSVFSAVMATILFRNNKPISSRTVPRSQRCRFNCTYCAGWSDYRPMEKSEWKKILEEFGTRQVR